MSLSFPFVSVLPYISRSLCSRSSAHASPLHLRFIPFGCVHPIKIQIPRISFCTVIQQAILLPRAVKVCYRIADLHDFANNGGVTLKKPSTRARYGLYANEIKVFDETIGVACDKYPHVVYNAFQLISIVRCNNRAICVVCVIKAVGYRVSSRAREF